MVLIIHILKFYIWTSIAFTFDCIVQVFDCNFTLVSAIILDWLIMMVWDYVSELRPPTGLFFIRRMICEHGELWWWRCRLDSSTRELWQSYYQRHLGEEEGMDEGVRILPISIWNTSRDLQYAVKSYDLGPPSLLPIQRNVCCGFLSPLKIHRFGRVWTREPWVQWQVD
jgi:hypothetical protein